MINLAQTFQERSRYYGSYGLGIAFGSALAEELSRNIPAFNNVTDLLCLAGVGAAGASILLKHAFDGNKVFNAAFTATSLLTVTNIAKPVISQIL